jgi:hypothetical protein
MMTAAIRGTLDILRSRERSLSCIPSQMEPGVDIVSWWETWSKAAQPSYENADEPTWMHAETHRLSLREKYREAYWSQLPAMSREINSLTNRHRTRLSLKPMVRNVVGHSRSFWSMRSRRGGSKYVHNIIQSSLSCVFKQNTIEG